MSYCHTPGYKTKLVKDKTTFIIWGKYKGKNNNIPKITSVDGAKFSQGDNHLYLRDIDNDLLKKQTTSKGIENANFDLKIKHEIDPKINGCGSLTMPDKKPDVRHYDNGLNIGEKGGGTFFAWGEMLDGMMSRVSGRFISYDDKEFTVENAFKTIGEENKRGKFYDIRTKQENAIQFDKDIEECMTKLLGMNIIPDDDESVGSEGSVDIFVDNNTDIEGINPMPLKDSGPASIHKSNHSGISLANFMNSMKHNFEINPSPFHHRKTPIEDKIRTYDDFNGGALNEDNNANLYFLSENKYEEQAFIEGLIDLENKIKTYSNNKNDKNDKIDQYIQKYGNQTSLNTTNALVYHYSKEKKSDDLDLNRPNHLVIIFYIKDDSIYYRITSSNIYSNNLTSNDDYSYEIVLDNDIKSDILTYLYKPKKNENVQAIGDNSEQSLFQPVGELETDIKSFTIEPVFSYAIHEGKINYTVSYFRIDLSVGTYLIDFEKYKNFENNLHYIQTINGNEVEISKDNHIVNKNDVQKEILYYHKIDNKKKGGSNIRKRKTKHKRKRKNATLKK